MEDKKSLTETEIRTRYITPAIISAGWELPQVREEFYYFTISSGNPAMRNLVEAVLSPSIVILERCGRPYKFSSVEEREVIDRAHNLPMA